MPKRELTKPAVILGRDSRKSVSTERLLRGRTEHPARAGGCSCNATFAMSVNDPTPAITGGT